MLKKSDNILYVFGKIMKEINKTVLKDAANRLFFDMSEEEYDTLLKEFDIIVKQMELIGKIEGLESVEPMTFPFDCTTSYLREDVSTRPLNRDDALKNAHSVKNNQIKLPKVVG